MKIIVDADACPVIEEIIEAMVPTVLVRSRDHFTLKQYPDHVEVFYVDKGADSADYAVVKKAASGDIVITQDYGLASLLIDKDITVLHQSGKQYTADNIDMMLMMRHISAKARRSGAKTKGPKKFTAEDRSAFKTALQNILEKKTGK